MPSSAIPGKVTHSLQGHGGPVHAAVYSSDGAYALTGCQDRLIRLYNAGTGALVKTYTGHGWEVLDVCVAQDNSTFASCGGDRSAFLWDVATGQVLRRFPGHTQRVNAVALNQDASVIATGSYDTTVNLWDCRAIARMPIQTLKEAKDSVTSLVITSNTIFSGSVDEEVRAYDLRAGGSLTSDCIGAPVTHISPSKDERCILTCTLDDRVRLMDREDGSALATFKGHANASSKVRACFGHDDAHVLSGSEDGRLVVWDILAGKVVRDISAHKKSVTAVAAHPKGQSVLSSSFDGSVFIWGVNDR
ncbi:WD40-repeat-containing domain protein [Piptocephalis cylindrospora]|uniref:WD40-repeat-containing domain protein n=1 Tax=Piptocephalis cylindrospora TaxID=1907219 RepID=A0A4P9Y5I4_9FUNG|nr:WD40-repeat-containing domain protein [Piptocephalis cylindrospora]|eukprot:RKP14215.1 WD40-repeat-containing domain protein [Piptocephalis cylindrospora]